ncbi:hypothetical protein [Escherichia phage vB_EcoM_APEC]|nr:hypothetical protein [Escherichia phage vB_EcoM_APEC]
MREQFEKLPEIANSLSQHIYFGDDNLYHSDLINFQKLVCWINGAWYAFQEQQKVINDLNAQLKAWKSQSMSAMIHGTCSCGEPWQGIVSDREGFSLLHCFNCNNNRYENKEYFGDHEHKALRGEHD